MGFGFKTPKVVQQRGTLPIMRKNPWRKLQAPHAKQKLPSLSAGSQSKGEMKILQLNLNHCRAAQDLLAQTVRALKIGLAILSEPYASKHDGIWFQNSQGGASIWSCSPRPLQIQCRHSGRGFVRAKVGSLTIYSCYIAPSVDSQTFGSIVDDILEDARGRHPIIIAGDFNAWATEWGSRLTNHRGHILLARSGLTLANTGTANTYEKAGMGSVMTSRS
ncbi:uncharacterized protein LOC122320583 [Drosophila ficusphila]|uniref:uncharacterized protein LOC122320583 n=1 Tax=Drosophila ficusphila TaxID=30025 RepID=UPI001C89EC77|nr:uncharacterized protein LOC122320583 [Drosophila ficusphila]